MSKHLPFVHRPWNHFTEYGFRSTLSAMRNFLIKQTFRLWEKLGFYIIPKHYYYPIPETKDLILREETIWRNSELVGIDMKEETQLRFLKEICPNYKEEYVCFADKNRQDSNYHFYFGRGGIAEVDAEVLYCMIRYSRPSTIIEIGSGSSTLLIAEACRVNKKEDASESKFVTVDPYPPKNIRSGISGLTDIVPERLEELDLGFFQQLESGDVLFIDSTHVVKIAGDVNYLYLEVLPRLKAGVVIHAHDIFLPSEYPKEWVLKHHRFWTEQYLLQAFLTHNSAFEILWGGHYMHLKYPDELGSTFPSYNPKTTIPGSFWMRRKKT